MNGIYELSDHAMLDTFPLRFGIIPPRHVYLDNVQRDLKATNNQKPKEIELGNYHAMANCLDVNRQSLIASGRFVLSSQKKHKLYPTLITAFSNEYDPAERSVSDLIRSLRDQKEIDTAFIIDYLHKPYKQGEIGTSLDLYKYLVSLGVKKEVGEYENAIEMVKIERDEALDKLAAMERRLEVEQRTSIEKEKTRTDYHGESIDVSPVCTLREVVVRKRTKGNGEVVDCTYLSFEETVPERKMDHVFDRNWRITDKAHELVGKKVYTTTWKPEIFKPMEWFRNIYEASV